MLVGVEVGRVAAEQRAEALQLGPALGLDRRRVVAVAVRVVERPLALFVVPLAEIDVEADRQLGVAGGLARPPPAAAPGAPSGWRW